MPENNQNPIEKNSEDKKLKSLSEEKRKFFFEIIKIRLDGIGEAAKRARITFIISIIASCSILITLFNTYYSWTQRRGFDNTFKYQAVAITNEKKFIERLEAARRAPEEVKKIAIFPVLKNKCEKTFKESNNPDYTNTSDKEKHREIYINKCAEDPFEGLFDLTKYKESLNEVDTYPSERDKAIEKAWQTAALERDKIKKQEQLWQAAVLEEREFKNQKEILSTNLEKFRKNILMVINEDLLNEPELYKFCGEGKDFYIFFAADEKIKTIQPPQEKTRWEKISGFFYSESEAEKKAREEKEKDIKGKELKYKIWEKIFQTDTANYYDPTNHLNKIILQKTFPEIEWKAVVRETAVPVSIYEDNKRSLSREWIENQNVRINLLGISINVDQFSLIGSFALMVITIWMSFAVRRENRSIVTLLRDVSNYVGFPKKNENDDVLQPPENDPLHDNWKIADLTLHGIAQNLIFSQIGKYDLPMSENNIFDPYNKIHEPYANNITEIATKFFRGFAYLLLFLPAISIGIILWVDQSTTTNMIYPYANNPIEYFINRNVNNFPKQIDYEINIGKFFGFVTFLVCFTCFIYQKRTASAMKKFEEHLGKENFNENSWWESYVQRPWLSLKSKS